MIVKPILFVLTIITNFFLVKSLEEKKIKIFVGSLTILVSSFIISHYYLLNPNRDLIILLSLAIIPIYFFNYILDNFAERKKGIIASFPRLLRKRIFYLVLTAFQLISILELYNFFKT